MRLFLIALFMMTTFNLFASEKCNSDFDCESLCCHSATKTCGEHNPEENIFCGKKTGDSCIISNMCEQLPALRCRVVKTGQRTDGSQTCALKCSNVKVPGRCIENTCHPPVNESIPDFDPNDCSTAVDP